MRPLPALLLTLGLTGCGDSHLTVRGTLLPGTSVTDVYVVGQPLRSRIEADSFVLSGIRGQVVELEFAENSDRLGRMRIERWTRPEVALRGIWVEDGTAFATALQDAGSATVNGLRMAADREVPRELNVEGVVLALSGRGDALIVRPLDSGLPDLRVVLTPGTALEDESGPGLGLLSVGDTLRVAGTSESGYLVATRMVVRSRPAAEGLPAVELTEVEETPRARESATPAEPEAREESRDGPRSLQRPGGGRGRGRGLQRRRD